MTVEVLRKELKRHASKEKAKILRRFFKTGPGEYGEGDVFLGVMVPQARAIAKKYQYLSLAEIARLLHSPIHEERLLSLIILILQFTKADSGSKEKIFKFYLKNTRYVNNWDLVDLSAPNIVGYFLQDKDRKVLYRLAKSNLIWERRIAILATFSFIRRNEFGDACKIINLLLQDQEELIHKAAGWMLREVGKRDISVEEEFLRKYHKAMPRIMLRYALERFPEHKRQAYLKSKK